MRKFGLIGKSLKHSFSKSFFEDFYAQNSINAVYSNYELESIEDVKQLLESDMDGFNVTNPYKEDVQIFLDYVSEEAKEIGAVNVVKIKNGKSYGFNTDGYGFQQSIKPFLTNKHERAMLIGTGGASKAVAYVLNNIGLDIIYISRNPQGINEFGYDEINHHMIEGCKLIVNCTPVGTFPEEELINLPYEFITKDHLVVDLVYNPERTPLLKKAESKGASILNGMTMLKYQALKSWEIWNNG